MGRAPSAGAADSPEEQVMVRDSAISFRQRDAQISRLKTLKQSDLDFDPAVWRAMVELGWSAMLVPADCDGLDLGLGAAAIVVEELGRVVAPEPLIETAGLAVSLLGQLPQSSQRQRLLRDTAAGDVMPVVCATEYHAGKIASLPVAEAKTAHFALNGSCDCVPLARAASGFLLPAQLEGEIGLFWVPRSTRGLTIESRLLADNTSHAKVSLNEVELDHNMLLGRGACVERGLAYAMDVAHVLTAAYLCGLMAQALASTIEYLCTRKQFGRAIGSFQALQHRAVDLFIQSELASSVVSAAVACLDRSSDPIERTILASRAKFRAGEAALLITRAAIQMHGAIGFTYECDIGHYLNRAMVLGSRRGNTPWHLRRLSELLHRHDEIDAHERAVRDATIANPPDKNWNDMTDDDFRGLVRTWFEQEYPAKLRYPSRRLRWLEIKDWYLKLSAKGWLAPNWPVKYGGMGLSPAKFLIFIEEQERWGVARAPDMGITMIGPLLTQHGSADQRAHYLPKILAGENIWCQGYSEPNAGSDLASLQCAADLSGDEFIVNGQKTWTTLAQDATHIFLLVRTDRAAKKQAGISFLLLDLRSPGITIRPIRNLAGDEEFCEVFFDDVRVPAENLVGKLNAGWSIAKALLSFERIFLGSPKQSQYALQRLEGVAIGMDLFVDSGFSDRFTRLKVDVLDLETVYSRFAQIVRDGGTLGPEVSLLKIWASETLARLSELMLDAAGDLGPERGDLSFGSAKANILSQFYIARAATIYGGSNEIQRNIIAKHVLHLPDP